MAGAKTAGTWLLQVLMAVMMAGPGIQKFTSPVWQRMFRVWGLPEHFYLVIGAIEVIAGAGLLVPRTAAPSALALMAVMAGAFFTQITHGRNGLGEIVFFVLLGVIAYLRRGYWIRRHGDVAATV